MSTATSANCGCNTEPKWSYARIFSRANEGFSLTVRNGEVVLAPAKSSDECQQWIKHSSPFVDASGFKGFALVNKATGEAIKAAIGEGHKLRLTPYIPDALDKSILWTEGPDEGDGFHAVRMMTDISLNFDALCGNSGVYDGIPVGLYGWNHGTNQQWKIIPHL